MKNRSSRILSFAFLSALILGQAVLPIRSIALQTAVAPTSVTAASKSSQAAPATDKEAKPQAAEENESDAFRHSAMVQIIAKKLGLSVETTARIAEYINVGVIVLFLGWICLKTLPKTLRTRRENLKNSLESARKLTEDAGVRLKAVEAKLANMDQEIAQFRADVEHDSQQDEARIKASLSEESARIVAAAEQEITTAAAQARRGLQRFAADMAIEQAAKQLVLTPETDRALIAEFAGELSKGGKKN